MDVGGTKTHVGVFEQGKLLKNNEFFFKSNDYTGIEEILDKILRVIDKEKVDGISVGVAGPVKNGNCQLSNINWYISCDQLQQRYNIECYVVNDVEALSFGLLSPDIDTQIINAKKVIDNGVKAIVAAGTGFGQSALLPMGQTAVALASEGGHVAFAPLNDDEDRLLQFLRQQQSFVAVEHIVSGMGIVNIFEYLLVSQQLNRDEYIQKNFGTPDDLAQAISQAAIAGNKLCQRVVQMFFYTYGAVAGNVALSYYALGGVYIGGGIAPKIMQGYEEVFMQGFLHKEEKFAALLEEISVQLIIDPLVALKGCYEVSQRC